MSIINKLRERIRTIGILEDRVHKIQEALGRIEARQLAAQGSKNLVENEFRVFSQWGEDGIIQYLVSAVNIDRKIFIEFGVQNYTESNTRFLLINNNWSGLIIDSDQAHIDYIRSDPLYWQYNLKSEKAFITCENINALISAAGIQGEVGLLSIDIDGNDYWVWKAIEVISPVIVIVEYNARFGVDAAVTVPYDPGFIREHAHPSRLYFGASLKALFLLGEEKGYAFVGCNSAGNNAFFVRRDRMPDSVPSLSVSEGFVRHQYRESRDALGQLTFDSPDVEAMPKSLPLVQVG